MSFIDHSEGPPVVLSALNQLLFGQIAMIFQNQLGFDVIMQVSKKVTANKNRLFLHNHLDTTPYKPIEYLHPMPKKLLFVHLFSLLPMSLQDVDLQQHVLRKWPDGKPYVVVYTSGPDQVKVKEELYYDNGQLDYSGSYLNGKEHGEWKYYWENGNIKSIEYYERGLENGTMYDYNENGQPIVEYKYVRGQLISEKKLKP